ncbi:uncharacterized protein PV07_01109 [Cladophialophora immunda]|uniref:tRNA wybutosine-synthesizing protein 2 n=1 Tax=Cladophialophora immunda TaxID=569365 RepID=A0A0D2DF37_9EURO|nr:uncharacterized protein PV07_01109 [Cladophialophora immunda]KIW34324.1 hypothetical protein PV07_01109 [Cladophialophora immunda]
MTRFKQPHSQPEGKFKSKRERLPNNPLVRGVYEFCKGLQEHRAEIATTTEDGSTFVLGSQDGEQEEPPSAPTALATADMPKRYTLYPPLLLLPPNFTTQNPRWTAFYHALGESDRTELFRCIAGAGFKGMGISRVAINAPIAAEVDPGGDGADGVEDVAGSVESANREATPKEQNALRSPSGLVPMYGDWAPVADDRQRRGRILHPTAKDFDEAFWASTSQHQGVVQCWAPLYTMFSRGNISEKARILGLQSHFPGLDEPELNPQRIGEVDVVDLYVGIGYFAFCYLFRGVRRVYGWDINPWSIEGLRRGCERNGWRCLVVRVGEDGSLHGQGGARELAEEIARGDHTGDKEAIVRCVAFLGDNKWTCKVLKEMQYEHERVDNEEGRTGLRFNIRHANLGLLPSAIASWENAVKAVTTFSEGGTGGWLHVHENVDVREIDVMSGKIVGEVDGLIRQRVRCPYAASGAHVEQVKTYAPGVMHCVFDIEIKPNG